MARRVIRWFLITPGNPVVLRSVLLTIRVRFASVPSQGASEHGHVAITTTKLPWMDTSPDLRLETSAGSPGTPVPFAPPSAMAQPYPCGGQRWSQPLSSPR